MSKLPCHAGAQNFKMASEIKGVSILATRLKQWLVNLTPLPEISNNIINMVTTSNLSRKH